MTPELLAELASELAEVSREAIRGITVRDEYGYVDCLRPEAEAILKNLNGIEYNGFPLPVEVATILKRSDGRHNDRRNAPVSEPEGESA
jgi:RNA recognition motif-containing protein